MNDSAEDEIDQDPRAIHRLVRDPVHGYVHVPRRLVGLIEDPLVQRLRRVSQTAMAQTLYPSMNGSRFEHVLGSMHLARQAWFAMWSNSKRYRRAFCDEVRTDLLHSVSDRETDRWVQGAQFTSQFEEFVGDAVAAAALLHDVGHPPFSHTLEPFYRRHLEQIAGRAFVRDVWQEQPDFLRSRVLHERVGYALVTRILEPAHPDLPWSLIRRIAFPSTPGTWAHAVHDLISGEVDIDRLDYLLRDAQKSATEFGNLDVQRLLTSLELHRAGDGSWNVGFGVRATSALESFLVQRLQYYRWVVFHPTVIGPNHMLVHALERSLKVATSQVASESILDLNFFAGGAAATDRKVLAYADDATVISRLKTQSRAIQVEVPPASWSSHHAQFLALTDAVVHGAPNWAPLWKKSADYRRWFRATRKSIFNSMNELIADIDEAQANARSEPDSMALHSRLSVARQAVHWLEGIGFHDGEPYEAGRSPEVSMNELGDMIFQPRQIGGGVEDLDRGVREVRFADVLLASAPDALRNLPGATWIVCYEEISITTDGEFATNVYTGGERETLSKTSDLVESLNRVELKRPHFYCYFVAHETSREVIEDLFRKHVSELIRAFAVAVVVCLNDFFVAPPPDQLTAGR